MGQIIKTFRDGSFLEYDWGNFDEWCVYFTDSSGVCQPPRDVDYFSQLRQLAYQYGADKVYGDYVCVYDMTGKEVSRSALENITQLAGSYGRHSLQADIIFPSFT